jgi:hypothetical protein
VDRYLDLLEQTFVMFFWHTRAQSGVDLVVKKASGLRALREHRTDVGGGGGTGMLARRRTTFRV